MNSTHFKRVIGELCQQIGFAEPETLFNGGKLRINENLVSFVFDETYNPGTIYVYVDMGAPDSARDDVYKTLLKVNFQLLAGERGILSMHPKTNHLFYAFCYPLTEEATGLHLLDSLVRFIGGVGVEALELPEEKKSSGKSAAATSRARINRMLAATDDTTNPA